MAQLPTNPEANTITTQQMTDVEARHVEFTLNFVEGIKKLTEALGITRMIPRNAGTVLKAYKATGTLGNGVVGEGEIIPLSQYSVEAVPVGEIAFKKWRKKTSAEAIAENGYDIAVQLTTDKMLVQAQRAIRTQFFGYLGGGTGEAEGTGLQAALADAWGQLQVKYEDYDDVAPVYFVNPLDIADYLGSAAITTQTVFGMQYIENFLGLGTVFTNTSVPKGKFYATAKSNIVCYYIPANDANGLGAAFDFTTDQTGLVAIKETADYDSMSAIDVVASAVTFFAEYVDGIVVGTINAVE